jgi:hypothetical protein
MSDEPRHLIGVSKQSLIHQGKVFSLHGLSMLANERRGIHNLVAYRQVVRRGADSHMEFVESKALVIHRYRS